MKNNQPVFGSLPPPHLTFRVCSKVNLYADEGALLGACVMSRSCNATALKWQAAARILATGWEVSHPGKPESQPS